MRGPARREIARDVCCLVVLFCALLATGCERSAQVQAKESENPAQQAGVNPAIDAVRYVRATGTIEAVKSVAVPVPQISGQYGYKTLVRLVPNGVHVNAGDVIAEFDRITQLDNARDAKAKYEDLSHQVDQRLAQNEADTEKRKADLDAAQAALGKAQLELSKGEVLAEIDRLENEAKAADAKEHVASLQKSGHFHELSDAAALKILELQRDRQKVAMERAERDADKLLVHAPISGMIALENLYRNNSQGHAQEGDQLYSSQTILRIFDPSEMEVQAQVGEADGAVLVPGCMAIVQLDAYPNLVFHARLVSSSPVAISGLGNPIKSFSARFRLLDHDPHLLPDLSASVTIPVHGAVAVTVPPQETPQK